MYSSIISGIAIILVAISGIITNKKVDKLEKEIQNLKKELENK